MALKKGELTLGYTDSTSTEPVLDGFFKSFFGKLLAGIIGAAVAIFLVAPVITGALNVAGYLLYGSIGAWGGLALFNEIF